MRARCQKIGNRCTQIISKLALLTVSIKFVICQQILFIGSDGRLTAKTEQGL